MSTRKADALGLVIGGEPRIDFLPPEVKARKQARRTVRSMGALVLVVVAACVAAYALATMLALQAQAALADEQARTQQLIQEQGQYAEARAVAGEVASVQHARFVGMANEVLWQNFLTELKQTLPSGSSLTSVGVDSIGAFEALVPSTVPLQGSGMVTVTAEVTAPSLPAISQWLDNLNEFRGFTSVWPGPAQQADGGYSISVTLIINSDVLEKRFFADYAAGVTDGDAGDDSAASEEAEEPTEEGAPTDDSAGDEAPGSTNGGDAPVTVDAEGGE